uniref:Coluporin-6 n=1 Tax=Colubraria reticulata TaxID=604273 RepID=A0A499RV89_9CAEN|nr:coluporin-6 [Colubraria reticulata]
MVLQFPRLKTLVIFLFVIGHRPAPVQMVDLKDVEAAASTNITPGSSITGDVQQELIKSGFLRTLAIFVENWTRYPLISPFVYHKDGYSDSTKLTIQPGMKEVFITRKTSYLLAGTTGVVSWLVEGAKRRLVLLWAIPYDRVSYRNWMALGLTPKGITIPEDGSMTYRNMYFHSSNSQLKFTRDKTSVIHRDADFTIIGTLTEGPNAVMKVVFSPTHTSYLAPVLLRALGLST